VVLLALPLALPPALPPPFIKIKYYSLRYCSIKIKTKHQRTEDREPPWYSWPYRPRFRVLNRDDTPCLCLLACLLSFTFYKKKYNPRIENLIPRPLFF
jgi:hypothetical protein